jgi:hypothetical protein
MHTSLAGYIFSATKSFLGVIFLFFFIFAVPFNFVPFNTAKVVLVVLFVLFLISNPFKYKLNKQLVYFATILCLIGLVALFRTMLSGVNDYTFPYIFLIYVVESLVGSILVYIFFLKNKTAEKFIFNLYFVILLQSLIVILMFVENDYFLQALSYLTSDSATQRLDLFTRYHSLRGFGLASSVTYDLSLVFTIGFIFYRFLISQAKSFAFVFLMHISSVFIVVSAAMSGRTGFILILMIMFYNFINKVAKFNFNTIINLFLIISILMLAYFNINIEEFESLDQIKDHAIEPFINYFNGEGFSTKSTNIIIERMAFIPPIETLLFGDGKYVEHGGYYMYTDLGYIRHVLFFGVAPSLVIYFLIYVRYFYYANYFFKNYKNGRNMIISIAIIFFIANVKGDFLIGAQMPIKIFCLLIVYSLLHKKTTQNKKHSI